MPPRPPPQRLVRRRPLSERIQSMLNPLDFYLWLSEEIQTKLKWDDKSLGTRFGLTVSFLFLLARSNAGRQREAVDDVFGDGPSNGWVTWLVNLLLAVLVPISIINTYYTLTRSRHYRLFEVNVENSGPSTPSAQRVRVDSAPVSLSPLRFFQDMLGSETAESRAHPDKTRDVWEIRVWDPYPATLQMFCLFSPGHVLVYMLFLPLTPLDPRPSVTVFKCLILQIMLSAQMLFMLSRFTQQAKDTAIIHREVLHEYDTKYVHPRLQPVVREIGTQVSFDDDGYIEQESVVMGTPSTLIRRTFQTHPNPNYAKYYDPSGQQQQPQQTQPRGFMTPVFTPPMKPRPESSSRSVQVQRSSPALRQSLPAAPPQSFGAAVAAESVSSSTLPPSSVSRRPSFGGGGSLGVYSHMNSPLKKATSMGDMNNVHSPRNSREMAALEQRDIADRMVRKSSPLKGESRRATTQFAGPQSHSPATLANARATRWTQERFPSRRF
ncbi:hypothetical protein B0H63DRAFT_118664 [Podospora didyma]|uniref:Meiotically up-regulated gene 154 protein n=1 Tax=Podospora didyma TaxID=330526 RepID=A0AAE0U4Q3_9PEZI|nr:hypothetical protein B0H63DRAFT_118664 [Podospora didyma]